MMQIRSDPLDEVADTVDVFGRPLVEIFSTDLEAPVGLPLERFLRTVDTAASRLAALMPTETRGYQAYVRVEPTMQLTLSVNPDNAGLTHGASGDRRTKGTPSVQGGVHAAANAIHRRFASALPRAFASAEHARDAPGVTYESTVNKLGDGAEGQYARQLFSQVCKPPLTVRAGKDEFIVGGVSGVPKAFTTADGRHAVLGCRVVAASLVRSEVTLMKGGELDLAGHRDHIVLEAAPVQSGDDCMVLLAIAMSFDVLVDIEVVKRKRVIGEFRGRQKRISRGSAVKSAPVRRRKALGPELDELESDEEYVVLDVLNADSLRQILELAQRLKS